MQYLLLKVVEPGDVGSLPVATEVSTTGGRRKEHIEKGQATRRVSARHGTASTSPALHAAPAIQRQFNAMYEWANEVAATGMTATAFK
jgi:hypothetical protein